MDLPSTQILNDNDDSFSSRSSESSQRTPKRLYQVATLVIGNKKYPIFKGINKVGRNFANDVCIQDITVSKIHAEIEADAKFAFVCDLRSSNKTRMNNEILRPERFYQLLDGAKLTFGVINGTYLFLRDNDESIIVPATPEPGLKLKKEPKKNLSMLNSSSNGESDDSVIIGTQEAQDEAVFVRPLAPNCVSNSKDSRDDAKPSTNRSNNDIYDEETQRTDKSEGSIHDSATQKVILNKPLRKRTSIYDEETQRVDNSSKRKIIFDQETQNVNDNSQLDDDDQNNISTQKLDNRQDKRIYDSETQKNDQDDQDDLENVATQKIDNKRNKQIYEIETQKTYEKDDQDNDLHSEATQKLDTKRKKSIHDSETQKTDKVDDRDDIYYVATQRFQPLDIKKRKSDIHDVQTQKLREKEDKSKSRILSKKNVNNSSSSHIQPQTAEIIMESDDENNEDDENYQPLLTQRVNMDGEHEGVEINAVQTVHDNEEKMENNLTKVSINKNNNDDKCNSEPRIQEESARNDVEIEKNKSLLTSVANQSFTIVEETDDESETDDEGVFASFLQKQDHSKAVCNLKDTIDDNVNESDLCNETIENNKIYNTHNNCPSPVLVSLDDINKSFEAINKSNNDDDDSDDEIYMTPNQIVSPLRSKTNSGLIKSPSNDSHLGVQKGSVDNALPTEVDLTEEITVVSVQNSIKKGKKTENISLKTAETSEDTQILVATQVLGSTQLKENKTNKGVVLEAIQALEDTQAFVLTQALIPTQIKESIKEKEIAPKATQALEATQAIEATQAVEDTQVLEDTQFLVATQVLISTQTNKNKVSRGIALKATQALENTQAIEDTQTFEATQSLIPTQILDSVKNQISLAETQFVNSQVNKSNVASSKKKQKTIQQPVLADTQAVELSSTQTLDTQLLKELVDSSEDEENVSNVSFRRISRLSRKGDDSHHKIINSIEPTPKLTLRGDKLIEDDAETQMNEVVNEVNEEGRSRKSKLINRTLGKPVKPLKLKKKQTSKNDEEWQVNRTNTTDDDSFNFETPVEVQKIVHKKEKNYYKLKKNIDKNQVNDSDSTDDELLPIEKKIPEISLKTPSSDKKISLSLNRNTKEELQKIMERNKEINTLKDFSSKSNNSSSEDMNKSKDEISETLNNMFGEPDDENFIEPTQLHTQQLMDILKSPKQISNLSEKSNHVDKFLQADNRGGIKEAEKKTKGSPCTSSPLNEESQELYFSYLHSKRKRNVILDSQGSSGSEKSSKNRRNSSSDKMNEPGLSGFMNGVAVSSDEKAPVTELTQRKRLRSNRKGTEVKKSHIDEPKAGPSNTDKKAIEEELDCPGSPVSISSSEEYMTGNTAKALYKQKKVAQARDQRINPDESDSDPVNDNDEDDEDFSFEKIIKIADRFLPQEMKDQIFSGDKKKTNLSNNNKINNSVRAMKKDEETKEGNRNLSKKPVNVVRTRRGQKKNPDLFIGQEEKNKTVIETKTREGRGKKNLETSLLKEDKKEVVKKQPTRSRKKTDDNTSSSNSSIENQEVAQIFDNKEKEITKKRPATSTSPSLIETKKKKLVNLDNSLNSSRRLSIRVQKHIVIFTGINNENYIEPIKRLGGTITENPNKATILVTDKVRRTFKFICAISRSIPIVSIKWIDACIKNHEFLDSDKYILRDQASEIRFDFDLNESLRKSSMHLLFQGYTFIITPKISNPTIAEFKSMIQVAGGKPLIRAPRVWPSNSVIVGCEADIPKIREMMAKIPKNISVPVVTTEFVLSGILKQTLDFETHKLYV